MTDVRTANLALLRAFGFRVAEGLPTERDERQALRPLDEIARRFFALDAVFTWVTASEEEVAEKALRAYAERNALDTAMTESERAVFALDRASANLRHSATIGWRLENMWPLAWVLGFRPEPRADGVMIPSSVILPMFHEFHPGLGQGVDALVERGEGRSYPEVDRLEDLFYCAHNAARSIQLGQAPAPDGFDPIAGTGVIHERRHALTWCLSPGVRWEDTDLST